MKGGSFLAAALLLQLGQAGLAREADARGRADRVGAGSSESRAEGARGGLGEGERARTSVDPGTSEADEDREQTEIEASRGQGLGRQEAASRSNHKKHRKLHPEEIARLMRRFDHEPSVDKAQRAAVRLALAGHQLPARLLRAAPRAAWLPKVQLGAGAQQRRDRRLEEEVGSPSFLRADAANQITYEIKLSWDLPRLIFEPNTLKVVREAQRITELREQVVMQVTRLYFERRRLQIEILARPSASAATALGRELRLAELTAILNALTGGLFGSRRGQGSVGR